MPQIWSMPIADVPLTGLERIPMLQGGGDDAARGVPILVTGAPFGGAVLALEVQMDADLSAITEADPGAGCLRWNNADPHAATEIYISDTDADSGDLSAALAALAVGGAIYIQGFEDGDALANLQRWQVTSVTAGSGFVTLGVSPHASDGVFGDGDRLRVSLQQPVPSPGLDRNVVTPASSSGGSLAFDAALGDYFITTLHEDVDSLTITNVPPACTLGFWITQAAGLYEFSWPGSFNWGAAGDVPVLEDLANGQTLFVVITTNDAGGTFDASARLRG